MFRLIIQKVFEKLAKDYLRKHRPKLIVVTGSVGKTTTKTAIATVLSGRFRVRMEGGNHNTHLSVPLAILGVEYPQDVHSPAAWLAAYRAAKMRVRQPSDADVIVQELGTDHPGDIARFGKYLRPDIAVITAVSPEHMEFFDSVEAVAREELAVTAYSSTAIINRDDIDAAYARYALTNDIYTYGASEQAQYRIDFIDAASPDGIMGRFFTPDWEPLSVNLQVIGVPAIKAAAAAGAVAARLGMPPGEIAIGMAKFKPVSGRMQLLRGIKRSLIVDDSYNSSPAAAIASLDTIYAMKADKRIAILGSMNELGQFSEQAHRQVGSYCDPALLDTLITIGEDAEKYLAPAARDKGCQVHSFASPYDAGGFAGSQVTPRTVILVKGSQNRVFAEEAVKVLLHDAADESRLVRQSPAWMKIKQGQFEKKFSDADD